MVQELGSSSTLSAGARILNVCPQIGNADRTAGLGERSVAVPNHPVIRPVKRRGPPTPASYRTHRRPGARRGTMEQLQEKHLQLSRSSVRVRQTIVTPLLEPVALMPTILLFFFLLRLQCRPRISGGRTLAVCWAVLLLDILRPRCLSRILRRRCHACWFGRGRLRWCLRYHAEITPDPRLAGGIIDAAPPPPARATSQHLLPPHPICLKQECQRRQGMDRTSCLSSFRSFCRFSF